MTVLDSLGMFDLAEGLPEQVEAAVAGARGLEGLPNREDVEAVVVLGMGGSGMAGDVLTAVAAPQMPVPVMVVKGYECPAFVGDGTLVFAVSASGDTEETIQAASDAAVSGARMVVVAGGGELARLGDSWGAPVIPVPADIPQPRAALGAMAFPPLVVLEDIGLFRGGSYWIDAAIDQLKRRRDALATAGDTSAAADVARRIGRTIPLIHGGGAVGSAAAARWKTQVNENAKAPAFWSSQPELCHNEVCGWGQHGDVTRQVLTAVALRHDGEHPQVGRRFDLVGEILREVVADVVEIRAEGDGDLAQLFDLVLFGDYVSLWMAAEAGIDPGPVPVLADLKAQLAGS
ncbi:bifunctional phosphoglucose/phosphomannose isomerase [Acidiferrimicrobium sp. IK]|uniref:bifunctional phosphoglucose/phosphomannose isomerase n=1 Tax=Acidiferrimicrobium sp. IK TaxID=2871700 RepID=UPI0021CB8BFE|nr:bifunctional phosphoglucose/phosphomannose isomerase [Acidiferrimicrobium sp. IK]MCU4185683.1 bifunctional phosphoglucose/phosphomannose isomerase [Acidiferrimicrobium sp. IK]